MDLHLLQSWTGTVKNTCGVLFSHTEAVSLVFSSFMLKKNIYILVNDAEKDLKIYTCKNIDGSLYPSWT